MTLYRRQGSRISPRKRNAKRQNGCLRRPYKKLEKKRSERQRIKEKIYPLESTVPKNSKGDMKTFFSDQCKEIDENNRMRNTRDLFKKIIPREHIMQR